MKFIVALSFLFTSADAFVLPSRFGAPSTALQAERSDAAEAIQTAMEATRAHGATSKEAMVAWDIVEEINSSDNSVAYKNSEKDALADPSKNKEMYDSFVELKKLGEIQRTQVESIKQVTEQIKAIKIAGPASWNDEHTSNPMFEVALTEAKAMTEEHGIESTEAKLAWETLEEIASNDSSVVMKQAIDAEEECLVEMIEACEAMEELNNVLFTQKASL